ncbi:hypothetical protein EVAR_94674_1 [Eumeta japonica]|uniref:Uncharacterized protein n=1 Tax=Eumeta variegata TaxID=151549 RepID=A0A4C1S9N0_EUMVA|nr:hypothetical protein EVAR_94674_1 [Eumeta japonica]
MKQWVAVQAKQALIRVCGKSILRLTEPQRENELVQRVRQNTVSQNTGCGAALSLYSDASADGVRGSLVRALARRALSVPGGRRAESRIFV